MNIALCCRKTAAALADRKLPEPGTMEKHPAGHWHPVVQPSAPLPLPLINQIRLTRKRKQHLFEIKNPKTGETRGWVLFTGEAGNLKEVFRIHLERSYSVNEEITDLIAQIIREANILRDLPEFSTNP